VVVIISHVGQVLSTTFIVLLFGVTANVALEKGKKLVNCVL
jgi:hypothetical protein